MPQINFNRLRDHSAGSPSASEITSSPGPQDDGEYDDFNFDKENQDPALEHTKVEAAMENSTTQVYDPGKFLRSVSLDW